MISKKTIRKYLQMLFISLITIQLVTSGAWVYMEFPIVEIAQEELSEVKEKKDVKAELNYSFSDIFNIHFYTKFISELDQLYSFQLKNKILQPPKLS